MNTLKIPYLRKGLEGLKEIAMHDKNRGLETLGECLAEMVEIIEYLKVASRDTHLKEYRIAQNVISGLLDHLSEKGVSVYNYRATYNGLIKEFDGLNRYFRPTREIPTESSSQKGSLSSRAKLFDGSMATPLIFGADGYNSDSNGLFEDKNLQ